MTRTKVVQCALLGGILLLVSYFGHLISSINGYDSFVEQNANIVSAFNG